MSPPNELTPQDRLEKLEKNMEIFLAYHNRKVEKKAEVERNREETKARQKKRDEEALAESLLDKFTQWIFVLGTGVVESAIAFALFYLVADVLTNFRIDSTSGINAMWMAGLGAAIRLFVEILACIPS